ncbi:hypothetical protein, variant [Spizellomyces punctatus DAOM BR117]|uniref:Uncharacterized protein n=1 Tax=Spizellomyces punctatus (strain DAOM BR117) TaxID=645134 RepID=A0A0L0H908_SPIPD|nr:hypothetical protein, variant [Spizellomyces punctatus DAOM BR117]KNC97486.1 hypothetical protein, variant [Spizellomyces punctatus DAOM BR117]|eukprot:XP_016605526.1 hypothetical protein, variant [Spizellomyces punctatus DAOM BR117]
MVATSRVLLLTGRVSMTSLAFNDDLLLLIVLCTHPHSTTQLSLIEPQDMLRFSACRLNMRSTTLRAILVRTTHTNANRLSAAELSEKLNATANPNDTITVDLKANQEMGSSGYTDSSYKIKVSDLKDILNKSESQGPATQPRFQYSSGHIQCYINSHRSSDVAQELVQRAQKNPECKAEPVEQSFQDSEYTAANKDMSKTTGSSQPTNL